MTKELARPDKMLFAIAGAFLMVSCGILLLYSRDTPIFHEGGSSDPTPANEVLSKVLASTIGTIDYTDADGNRHTYQDMTVAETVLLDIGLRDRGGKEMNRTSLKEDVETRIKEKVQEQVGTRAFTMLVVHRLETVRISGGTGDRDSSESAPVFLTLPRDGSDVSVTMTLG